MNEEKLQPNISVILPVFNGAKTLSNTLRSLINQTYNNYELIICNDGSTDNSEEIINSFKIKNIKVIKNNVNKGLGYTLNKLIKNINSNSKYIAMAEQDDYYYPDRLLLQYEYMERYQNVGLVSGIADHWDGTKITTKFPGLLVKGQQYPAGVDFFKFNYREQCKVVNSCMMIRKSIHQKYLLTFTIKYPSISVDWDYILRFSLIADIGGLNQSLVRLDRRPNRNSLTMNGELKNKVARKLIKDFYDEFPQIIKRVDYTYALATQKYLELFNKKYFIRIIELSKLLFFDPSKRRFINKSKAIFIKPIKRIIPERKKLFDRLAWFLSKKKFTKAFQLTDLNDIYNFSLSFVGYGYYDRISMSQKKNEIIKLAEVIVDLKPKIIVEIGTRKGGTLFIWSRIINAEKIISIDLPEGRFGGGYPMQKQKLYKYFTHDKKTEMHLIQNNSHSEFTLNKVQRILDTKKIDFLFIDGDHSYEGVKLDFELYRPFVKAGGIIVFHDIVANCTSHYEGDSIEVPRFWNEIKTKYSYEEVIENVNQRSMGIGILIV